MKGVSGYLILIFLFGVLGLSLYGIIAHGAYLGIWVTILLLIVAFMSLLFIAFISLMVSLVLGKMENDYES